MIKKEIQEKILKKAISLKEFGANDLTWEKESAKKLINLLMEDEIGILGGSVYKIDSNKLIPLYDNWYLEPDVKEETKEYYTRSKKKAFEYINNYPVYPDEKIIFSLVFTEDVD